MKLVFKSVENNEAEILFYPVIENKNKIIKLVKKLDYDNDKSILKRLEDESFVAKEGQYFVIHDEYQTIVFVGLGKDSLNLDALRRAAGNIMTYLKTHKVNSIGLELDYWQNDLDLFFLGQVLAEGLDLANYNFDKYKKKDTKSAKKKELQIVYIYSTDKSLSDLKKGWDFGLLMSKGTKVSRDLVNEPAGIMTPSFLAKQAQIIARQNKGVSVKIFDKSQIVKMKMNAFLAIAQGSSEAPKFIHLIYKPNKVSKKKIALVGKGITFDSGGLNVKPWAGMLDMKIDMGGAATVLGVFSILSKAKVNIEVHGIIAACENMSSGRAIKPGDVVTNMQGKSIEIAHTDAEGRVTLADSLAYTQKQGIKEIVDLATLTGSIVAALGPQYAGLFSRDEKLSQELLEASKDTGDKMWRLPLASEYKDANKSQIADIKNIDNLRAAGSITAAWFLNYFIEEKVSWAHIDIAGPAYAEKSFNSYTPAGGVGYGVRTLIQYLKNK